MSVKKPFVWIGVCLVAFTCLSLSAQAALRAQWNFDDGTFNDQVGALDGTPHGLATIVAAGNNLLGNNMGLALSTDTLIIPGFDYMQIGDLDTLGINAGNFTLTLWLKHTPMPTSFPEGGNNATWWDTSTTGTTAGTNGGFLGYIRQGIDSGNGGKLYANFRDETGATKLLKPEARIDDNQWHFVAIVHNVSPDPDTTKIYLDGKYWDRGGNELGIRTLTATDGGTILRLGDGFGGFIDDVRIYDHALSVVLNGSTVTGGEVYNVWHATAQVTAIPEPAALALLMIAAPALLLRRHRHQWRQLAWIPALAGLLLMLAPSASAGYSPELVMAEGLFDWSPTRGVDPAAGTETFTIYHAEDNTNKFANHPQITWFKGYYYVNWKSTPADENSNQSITWISRSVDGINWSAPIEPLPDITGPYSGGGWWTNGDTLACMMLYQNPQIPNSPKGTIVSLTTDGLNWSPQFVLFPDTIASAGPHTLSNGRMVYEGHGFVDFLGDGNKDTLATRIWYNDSPNNLLGPWIEADLPEYPDRRPDGSHYVAYGTEPSIYERPDGTLVMAMRHSEDVNNRTYRIWVSTSADNGETWTTPYITNFPDSSNMQLAGNLPDGTAYIINTPNLILDRIPLTISLSDDGVLFDRAYLVRGVPPAQRYDGESKTLGYSYAHATIHDGYLWITYATNKEDVEVTRIPLSSLMVLPDLHPGDANGDGQVNLADLQILGDNWQSQFASWYKADFTGDGMVNLADLQLLGDNWGFGGGADISFDEAIAMIDVPEPGSIGLLGLGGLHVMLRRRTRG
ncbi:MAG: exo-alpha-sialidase [Phycisphaeraceae bacterium]|nr:exo-alpha-sialidase [Phycisphaeraceae bacterium]